MVGAVGTRMTSVPYASEVHRAMAQLPDNLNARRPTARTAKSVA
jgi:hypothetical protein